jgi:hypothetical protein
MKKLLSLIITLSLFFSLSHSRFKFSDHFKRKDNEWKSLCDSPKGGDTVLYNGGFLVSSDGLYTDVRAGKRKLLYKKFKKDQSN